MKQKVLIIAEAGVNHNGDVKIAKELIDNAVMAGADVVKFQTFVPHKLVSRYAPKADYQKKMTGEDESQLEMLNKLSLCKDDLLALAEYSNSKGIIFISTPFDLDSIELLMTMDIPFFKIPSGEINDLPYLEAVGRTRKPVLLSTGMSNMNEIEEAMGILKKSGCPEISLLHCNSQYPTPFKDVNLAVLQTLREHFGVKVGYSDHTPGIEIAIAAAALGARIIEKHFTLDRTMVGPDHKSSLEPGELKNLIRSIRNIEDAIGSPEKKPSESEKENISIVRKSIVASRTIKAGDKFTTDNLTVKRPGTGISPMKWYDVLGQTAKKDYVEDELIEI